MFGRLTVLAAVCLGLSSHAKEEPLNGLRCEGGDASCESSDTIGLLQHSAPHHVRQHPADPLSLEQLAEVAGQLPSSEAPNSLTQLANGFGASQGPTQKVDCKATPALCSKLLNCNKNPVSPFEMMGWAKRLATSKGNANLRLWCMLAAGSSPAAVESAQKVGHCLVDKDMATSASSIYEMQLQNTNKSDAMASYCFGTGMCDDTEITFQTTQAQAEKICTSRYPKWKKIGFTDAANDVKKDPSLGSTYMAMSSCVMGVYQCDVAFCKATYCQSEDYKKKYGGTSQNEEETSAADAAGSEESSTSA